MNDSNFFQTNLSLNPEYFDDVIQLIEKEFHYNNKFHYEKDFLPLMNPDNFENCHLIIDGNNNQIVSHLALSKRTMKKNSAEIKVGFIGGIVTAPNYRGKKFFKNLLHEILEKNKEEIGLYFLWSDLENIYEKFSFYRTGGFIETGKQNLTYELRPNEYLKNTFQHISEKEFNEIKNLYNHYIVQEFFTVTRNEEDWDKIKEMDSVDLYYKKNNQGIIESYFCINKGHDLNFIIHEFATQKHLESQLIKSLAPFKLWLPEIKAHLSFNQEIYYSSFVKIGSSDILNSFLSNISNTRLKILKVELNQVEFIFKDKQYSAHEKEFLQYLFGPCPLEEFKEFNLSPYISGIDSV